MNFKGGVAFTVPKVEQPPGNVWNEFLNDKTENNFANPGVVRVNESIRAYVWAILGAQSQTRTSIIGSGTALDAQKQFVANVEDAINSPIDIPSSIRRYQDVLQYAQSKVDYVYGAGLYMSPSNIELKSGQVIGYNTKIVVATDQQKTGFNSDINTELITQTNAGETGIVKPQSPQSSTDGQPQIPPHIAAKNQQHIDEKKALIVGGVAAGVLMIWINSLLRIRTTSR